MHEKSLILFDTDGFLMNSDRISMESLILYLKGSQNKFLNYDAFYSLKIGFYICKECKKR